MKQEIKSK